MPTVAELIFLKDQVNAARSPGLQQRRLQQPHQPLHQAGRPVVTNPAHAQGVRTPLPEPTTTACIQFPLAPQGEGIRGGANRADW